MSCPTAQMSLKDRLDTLDGPVDIPWSFYLFPVLMIFTVTGIPLLYRRAWVFIYDLISDVRKELAPVSPPKGCRRVGWDGTRNPCKEAFTRDGYQRNPRHAKFLESIMAEGQSDLNLDEQSGRIEAMFLYPIKSTAPIEVNSAIVSETGFQNDRLFSFAQLTSSLPEPDGQVTHQWVFVTQRTHPRLALVKTELWIPDAISTEQQRAEPNEKHSKDDEWAQNGGCIIVHFPFTPDITFTRTGLTNFLVIWLTRLRKRSFSAEPLTTFFLPLHPSPSRIHQKSYASEPMKIWRELPTAWNLRSELNQETWDRLKFHLGISNPLTIFRVQTGKERELYKCAPGEAKLHYQPKVGFQDSYPIHVQNLESIRAVEEEVKKVKKGYVGDARRFRANVYVSGPKAFVEHGMLRMAIQGRSEGDVNSELKEIPHVNEIVTKDPVFSGPTTNESAINGPVTTRTTSIDKKQSTPPPHPILLTLPTRTPRCVMPNIDPSTASRDRDQQPVKHLKANFVIDKGTNSPILGMHAVPMREALGREVRVGDEVVFYRREEGVLVYNKDPGKDAWTEVW